LGIKVIITGVTGMVGEAVMLEFLRNPQVDSVLAASRKPLDFSHPKLKTFVVPDFRQDRERINEDAARKRIQLPTGAHETRTGSEEFLRIQQVDAQDVASHPAICFSCL
jgi:nucleoside-diphosphate-sugar epimerase